MHPNYFLALLFGAGVVVNLFQVPLNWANIGAGSGVVACLLISASWIAQNHRWRMESLEWLVDHKHEITNDKQYFENSPFPNRPVSRQTKLRRFKMVTSALIETVVDDVGGHLGSSLATGFIATIWTLLLGWWGLPWGPIRTIQALIINLLGGDKQTVEEVLLVTSSRFEFYGVDRSQA